MSLFVDHATRGLFELQPSVSGQDPVELGVVGVDELVEVVDQPQGDVADVLGV